MTGLWDQFQTFLWNIIHRPTWIDYIDIAIIAFLIYQLVKITRQTRAIQVQKGPDLVGIGLTPGTIADDQHLIGQVTMNARLMETGRGSSLTI